MQLKEPLFLNNRREQIMEYSSYEVTVAAHSKAWQIKINPFGCKMPAELLMSVIPENDDSLEDNPLLPLLLLSSQAISLPLIFSPNI